MSNQHYVPILKEVKPISFLLHRAETTLGELHKFIPIAEELFKEAVENDLRITGPIHWHYFGFNGDAAKPFTLEVVLPIAETKSEYDGKFHFKRTELYKCVSVVHDGNWYDMPASYDKIMKVFQEKELQPIGVSREIYINSDFKDPEANSTEIQVGYK